ncbi:hypothetical protein EV702DRAFT_1193713 [Suillus placidus]|uniref:Uncharacterized protein n=1 Tax=Suillus placidus TaxID=48579 RepID=A0A9P7D661_9AGAM|nr:hypothetical protein EV702DRAFT_1193713 [Suillus placidus]
MSIPRATDVKAWALFCSADFKPFSASSPLLCNNEDFVDVFNRYSLLPASRHVMNNWEAVHECEDERDTDRMRKQANATAERRALTNSLALTGEEDFRILQVVLLMQQAKWLSRRKDELDVVQCDVQNVAHVPDESIPQPDNMKAQLKRWKAEIKHQENLVSNARWNALNTDTQVKHPTAETELTSPLLHNVPPRPLPETEAGYMEGASSNAEAPSFLCTHDVIAPGSAYTKNSGWLFALSPEILSPDM